MAVEGIDIDMQSVASLATNVEKIAATIDDELKAISSEMKNLETIWNSPAENVLKAKFKPIDEKRDKFSHDLKEYAAYLRNVAESYVQTEQQINRNAESFK